MANIKSQIKRNRQNERRRLRNRNFRGSARTAVKDAHAALSSGGDEGNTAVVAAISALDRAAKKGAIHPRNASRRKSRLMKQLAKSSASGAQQAATKTTARKSTARKAPAAKTSSEK